MAYTYGVMPAFSGVRMDVSEALMSADLSPDACNMDTRSGDLKSATGFSWATRGTLPSGEKLLRLIIYPNEHGMRFLAVTETGLYSYRSVQYGWRQIYPFEYEGDGSDIQILGRVLGVLGTDDKPSEDDMDALRELFHDELAAYDRAHGEEY